MGRDISQICRKSRVCCKFYQRNVSRNITEYDKLITETERNLLADYGRFPTSYTDDTVNHFILVVYQ